ncbi:penicillin-binding protein [Candidatus Shapirobacteria bacterium CG07_land_8_20_14_0_80_39_12]|uniref:Penicillin-binding protein n=3 Tax=Microgenomates group TaxID=1794810 RepID=A0A2M6YQ84_9BACT|nr:MAG: penicillin-binding protein [Candidatus Shapirobacteria bacterium CG07_land_8_20_14_0_80_39_12]
MKKKIVDKKSEIFKKFLKKYRLPIGIGAIFFLILFFWIFKDLPSPTRLGSPNLPASTLIYDRNGQLLYEIYAEKNRVPVKLEELSEYIKWATVASEDKNFYRHHGFDLGGILRATFNTVFRRTLQGGSTLTQQLVKNALLEDPSRTLRRKIREAILTWGTEVIYSKNEILEMYLNQAPFGGTAWGIESAAQTYFNKKAKDLTLAEATLLIGLPASPTRFSPFGAHPELAKERQKRVLQRMVEDGYLSKEESEEAEKQELDYASPTVGIKAPHFVLYVKELLVDKYGEKMVEQGGLKVQTTLDLDLQEFSQQAVASEVAKLKNLKISNGAALITNPETGEILSMVGSKDYFDKSIDGNVNVTLSSRQPGSSIKPLNYGLALEKKIITPATVINDMPTCFSVPGQRLYCPVNYDRTFHGPTQVRFTLGNSYNLPAVKVLALNGLEDFVAKAKEMGISTFTEPKNYGLSITLGGGEVKMIDMATAFSSFANLGIRQDVWAIKKVENQSGKVLFEKEEEEGPRVLSMETAYLVSHILLDNNARSAAFGPSSYLVIKNHPEVSVKTGTTNDLRDNWTIGYTPSRLAAVWVGNNDNTSMSYVASGVTGASPIWNKIMTYALKDQKQEWPLKPEGIVGASICQLSGKIPNPEQPCETRFEYFAEGTVPSETENLKMAIEIDKTNGQMANEKTPPENKEIQEHQVIIDSLGTKFCLDCSVATQSATITPSSNQP